jgi:hypothetical protein
LAEQLGEYDRILSEIDTQLVLDAAPRAMAEDAPEPETAEVSA